MKKLVSLCAVMMLFMSACANYAMHQVIDFPHSLKQAQAELRVGMSVEEVIEIMHKYSRTGPCGSNVVFKKKDNQRVEMLDVQFCGPGGDDEPDVALYLLFEDRKLVEAQTATCLAGPPLSQSAEELKSQAGVSDPPAFEAPAPSDREQHASEGGS